MEPDSVDDDADKFFCFYMEQDFVGYGWQETEMTEKKEKIIESATFAAHANNRWGIKIDGMNVKISWFFIWWFSSANSIGRRKSLLCFGF